MKIRLSKLIKLCSPFLIALLLITSIPIQSVQASTYQITNYNISFADALQLQVNAKGQTDKKYDTFIRSDFLTVDNPSNPKSGTVNRSSTGNVTNVRVRGGAGTHFWEIGLVKSGDILTVLGSTRGQDGYIWYQIAYNKTWVNASPTDIEQYLNPNNFQPSSNQFFQFLKLSESAGLDARELNDKILFDKGALRGTGQAFINAGKTHKVNEIYLISHALLETGNGLSSLARGVQVQGKTVYNMYGIGAFDSCPHTCGAQYAYDQGWFTPEAAIIGGAEFVARNYLNRGQDTLYKMKWNPANPATHQYATDIGWAVKQTTRMANLYGMVTNYTLAYDIPRYQNQPGNPPDYSVLTSKPAETQSNRKKGFTTSNVNLRSEPRVAANTLITTIAANQDVEILQKNSNDWYQVRVNNRTGWIAARYIEETKVSRIQGANAYATSALISQEGWNKSDVVIITRGDRFSDALAGVPLAAKHNAPLLLSRQNRLDDVTRNEIIRLGAKQVIVLGGPLAIQDNVVNDIRKINGVTNVRRIAGNNMHDTAALISNEVAPNGANQAIIVSDNRFQDALSVASYAGANGIPILLANTKQVPKATQDALKRLNVKNTLVIGGPMAISENVAKNLPSPRRIEGATRFDTNIAAFNHFKPNTNKVYLATSERHEDALSGAALAAKENVGVILVDGTRSIHNTTRTNLTRTNYSDVNVLGGHIVITNNIYGQIRNLVD
ncbi:cell wall-binding repeat-containing protein [Halalkalibacter akibai]|uniref:Beta-N-acetylglucosaminidase n=1 Tax=Halalkalibacter akibai (strain ATCC 43226 / DSM 21942 / CIP 109018 / JCM 9157 / 1139) TaxID=1236973 RepID=W4QW02_HALA3|nr:cell wall-binding repeat-containing protein [Halalkalibacter akibai]GAE35813.1 beta-N-acetylglucosaminidase [Halalkalibacter akibai JCM 9157]